MNTAIRVVFAIGGAWLLVLGAFYGDLELILWAGVCFAVSALTPPTKRAQ